jgi:hypothetical protein
MGCGRHRIDRQLREIDGFWRPLYKAAHLREPSKWACPESTLRADTEAVYLSSFIAVARLKSFTQAATAAGADSADQEV